MFVNEKYIEKMRIISHFAIAYLSISLYTELTFKSICKLNVNFGWCLKP